MDLDPSGDEKRYDREWFPIREREMVTTDTSITRLGAVCWTLNARSQHIFRCCATDWNVVGLYNTTSQLPL